MIEVRTETAAISHRGVTLVGADTVVVLSTRWFTLKGGYRRPRMVETAQGGSIRIRDHALVARLAAVILALMLMKGRKP